MTVKDVLEVLYDNTVFIYSDYGDLYHEGPKNKVEDDVLQLKVVGLTGMLEDESGCNHIIIIVEGE